MYISIALCLERTAHQQTYPPSLIGIPIIRPCRWVVDLETQNSHPHSSHTPDLHRDSLSWRADGLTRDGGGARVSSWRNNATDTTGSARMGAQSVAWEGNG